MVRQLCVNILNESKQKFTIEAVENVIQQNSRTSHVCVIKTGTSTMVRCNVGNSHTTALIDALEEIGVGKTGGCWIDVINLKTSIPKISSKREVVPGTKKVFGREFRVSDRVAIEEIYETVDGGLHLTFDYLAMTLFAGVVCSVGLLTNSSVIVVSSMLLSPLMGPILATCLGAVIQDQKMIWKGVRNEFVGCFLTFAVGFWFGFVVQAAGYDQGNGTVEMIARGDKNNLPSGLCVAFASALALALSVTGELASGFVGVAIATAILPPVTCSGVYVGISVAGKDNLEYAGFSFLLFALNWVVIFIGTFIIFKLKNISPLSSAPDDYSQVRNSYQAPSQQPNSQKEMEGSSPLLANQSRDENEVLASGIQEN